MYVWWSTDPFHAIPQYMTHMAGVIMWKLLDLICL
jgi:hypothetical protein